MLPRGVTHCQTLLRAPAVRALTCCRIPIQRHPAEGRRGIGDVGQCATCKGDGQRRLRDVVAIFFIFRLLGAVTGSSCSQIPLI